MHRLIAAGILALAPVTGLAALTLADAQRLAVERSRQLGAHDAAIRSSLSMAHAAGQLPDPVLKLGVDNVPAEGGDKFSLTRDFMTMSRIGVMQEWTRSEKRDLRRERFEREAARVRSERLASVAAIRRSAAVAWLERYYAERVAAAVGEFARATETEIEAADAAYRAGKGSQVNVFSARGAAALAVDRRLDAERRLRAAQVELARWTGRAAEPLAELPAMSRIHLLEGSLEAHLTAHPELIALERQADVLDAEARLADASKRPDWTVEAAYQQRGSAYTNMFSVGVSIPLAWDAPNRQSREVDAKRAQAEEVAARREETLRAHMAEVEAMIEEWRAGRERRARFDAVILPLAAQKREAALAAYAGARGSLEEVVAARREELDLRLQALQLELEVARAWARLEFLIPDAANLAEVAR
jgi:outer membrane protein TolC